MAREIQSLDTDTMEGAFEDLESLERAYCDARSPEEADRLEHAIKERTSTDHFHFLHAGLQFVSRIQSSRDYAAICKARDFFARYEAIELWPFQLRGCKTVEQMEEVLQLHRRIAGGLLREFYDGGVHVLDLGACAVTAERGLWEAIGGAALHLSDDRGELMKVAGYFRWTQFRPETTVVSIQGTQGTEQSQREFRERLGIHPANALLLLFLQISRVLGQRKVRIRSRASPEYNESERDSRLYQIPRNHFRLKVNPATGLYEFVATRRDQILDKFARKHEFLAKAFVALESHLLREPTSDVAVPLSHDAAAEAVVAKR